MARYYFEERDSETCFSIETIKDRMRVDGLDERRVFEAERDVGSDGFWCEEDSEVYGKGICTECEMYKPRNGKNGICVSNRPVYFPSKQILIKL